MTQWGQNNNTLERCYDNDVRIIEHFSISQGFPAFDGGNILRMTVDRASCNCPCQPYRSHFSRLGMDSYLYQLSGGKRASTDL
ncbi:hypothetical protein CHS0354_042692 [Potamilus streckersoni]|uniref:Uncharacterized protein n=1 Tax=Potamilus streckersoni TaxID=2493646 RepID=A0AAE0S9Z7_9BIVA|nr:hypothetical protein CHS0354_042692 [Potamilus streckersoni]